MDARLASSVEFRAPAKINLALHVTGRRVDGYHELETLVVFTAFGDRVTATKAGRDSFEVTGPFAVDVPKDAGNLVVKAREGMRRRFGSRASPVAITLEKNLPVASGIGGGSSDAAAALKALAGLWGLEDDDGLAEVGGMLGADVPMCLAAQPLIARGIGERIELVRAMPSIHLVLVNPMIAVSTPAVFAALRSRSNPPLPETRATHFGDFASLIKYLQATRNDLEAVAAQIAPEIGSVLASLGEAGAPFARMSGSGATCFGIFETPGAAAAAEAAIRERHPSWFVISTETSAG